MSASILLLAPSQGLGGGIERYVSTVESALRLRQVPCLRLNLLTDQSSASLPRKVQFVRQVHHAIATSDVPVRVIAAHRDLLPVVMFVRQLSSYRDAVVIQHGIEVWAGRRPLGQRLVARPDIRVVAVSNFTAGALVETTQAQILPPGLTQRWFDTLRAAVPITRTGLRLLTIFRLEEWRSKGLGTLLAAIAMINHPDLHLAVCGSGTVPTELAELLKGRPDCRLLVDITDEELAREYASADVFVLATRTSPGAGASGEGFGLVLAEAQLAGTPVIGPAFGGNGDALQAGITGLVPRDESVGALAHQLARLVDDDALRMRMSAAAATWAQTVFDPAAYADRVVEALAGGADADEWTGRATIRR